MSQEQLFSNDTNFSSDNEMPGIRAKIIGVGGAGLSLVDGLRFDNFQSVEHLAVDVDSRALADSIAGEKLLDVVTLVAWGREVNFPWQERPWRKKKM